MGWPGSGAEAGPALSPAQGPGGSRAPCHILPLDAHTQPGDPARPLPEGGLPSTGLVPEPMWLHRNQK